MGRSVLVSHSPHPKPLDGELTLDLPAPALPVYSYHPTRPEKLGLQAAAANGQAAGAGRGGGDTNTYSIKLHRQCRQKENVGSRRRE